MDNNFFVSRISDTAELCDKNNTPRFLGFLTSEEVAIADSLLKKRGIKYGFFGGYEDAQRLYLSCLPDWCDEVQYPICAITFTFRKENALSHRDFLGALMSLGITREKIGDILIERGRAVVFASKDISGHILTQVEKIGRVGVKLSEGFDEPLPNHNTLASFSSTAASCRLDCVLSAIASISRSKANQLIGEGFVSINSMLCDKPTRTVKNGDKITLRGSGKFIIEDLNSLSKKGRIIVKYKKYI